MDGWLCKSFVHPLILQEGDLQYCSLFRLKLPSPIFPVSKDQCLLEYKSPLMHLQPGLKGPNLKSKKKKKSAPKALAACQQFPTLGANQCIFTFQQMYRQFQLKFCKSSLAAAADYSGTESIWQLIQFWKKTFALILKRLI